MLASEAGLAVLFFLWWVAFLSREPFYYYVL